MVEARRYLIGGFDPFATFVVLLAATTVSAVTLWLYHALQRGIRAFFSFRGPSVVMCPESGRPAGVVVDSIHAAMTALADGHPELALTACSRWPEKRDCGRACLAQLSLAPEDCLVRTLLTRWYAGKTCVYCGEPFGEIRWHDHKPALLGLDDRTLEWNEVPAHKVPEALAADRPVCWNCHIAETFRREYPDLVTDRPWRSEERKGIGRLRP